LVYVFVKKLEHLFEKIIMKI